MTPEQISNLERLEQAATPAPWPSLAFACLKPNIDTVKANRTIHLAARNALPALIRDWRIMRKALDKIASWNEGAEVTGSFDSPREASMLPRMALHCDQSSKRALRFDRPATNSRRDVP